MPRERLRVYYSGQVQGVGFRFTAKRLVEGFDVAGDVHNLPDGRVELRVEGEPAELSAFLDAVRQEFGSFIRDADVVSEPPGDPPPSGFVIRY